MAEQAYTPTEADMILAWESGTALKGRSPLEVQAEARRGIENIKAQVRAEERAKRPDREQVRRALGAEMDALLSVRGVFGPVRESYLERIADVVLSSLALEPEAREVTDEEADVDTRMLVLDGGAGPQHVGPFPNNHEALSWAREHRPDALRVASVMWPTPPGQAPRG